MNRASVTASRIAMFFHKILYNGNGKKDYNSDDEGPSIVKQSNEILKPIVTDHQACNYNDSNIDNVVSPDVKSIGVHAFMIEPQSNSKRENI